MSNIKFYASLGITTMVFVFMGFTGMSDIEEDNSITESQNVSIVVTEEKQDLISTDTRADYSGFGTVLIGTGSPQTSDERSSPSTLIYFNNQYFLIDMGEGTQDRLMALDINTGDIESLMFTHHHIDHNEEYFGIAMSGWLKGRRHLNVIGPPGTEEFHEFLVGFYEEDMAYRASKKAHWSWDGMKTNVDITEVDGDSTFDINGVTITTTEVPHTIHTQAYKFEVDGQSIVVTGDLKYSKALIELAEGVDLLIIDSGSIISVGSDGKRALKSFPDNAHASLSEVAEMAQQAGVKKLVLTHIGGDIDSEAEIDEIKKLFDGEVIIGSDLLNIDL